MNARDFALYEIDAKNLPGWRQDLRTPRPPRTGDGRASRHGRDLPPTDPRDLALAEQIAVGVTKNLFLLRHLIQHYSGRSLKSVDTLVQKILVIALYQLRFLTRVPASAAVDEAVEQAKRFRRARAAGFVNAVLRKATNEPNPPLPPLDRATEYATIVLSHPRELFRRLECLLGPGDAIRFCQHDQAEPPTIVRLATGVRPSSLEIDDVTLTGHNQPGLAVVFGARRAILADWAVRGLAQVQDPTSAAVVSHASVKAGQVILDRCCGRGTKTAQLRELTGDSGRIVAIDPADKRCMALRDLVRTRGFRNISVHCTAWLRELAEQADVPKQFDRAIVDVPCSNSGVLARRPEARFHQSEKSLHSLLDIQDAILDDTASAIKPGGLLVYSTCSVWPEENQDRVLAFVQRHPEFTVVEVQTTLPSCDEEPRRYHDGGYFAVLRRQ